LRDGDPVELVLPSDADADYSTGNAVRVATLDHRTTAVAARIHAISMWAYTQEAALVGAIDFPPLQRRVDDVRNDAARFTGAFIGNVLVGVLGINAGCCATMAAARRSPRTAGACDCGTWLGVACGADGGEE
jgi:hypothetical protein